MAYIELVDHEPSRSAPPADLPADRRLRRHRLPRLGGAAGVAHGRGVLAEALGVEPRGADRGGAHRRGRARGGQRRLGGVAAAVPPRAINSRLPADVAVARRWPRRAGFDARAQAPLAQLRVPHHSGPGARSAPAPVRAAPPAGRSTCDALAACAAAIVGTHDFTRVHAQRDEARLLRPHRARGASGAGSTTGWSSTSPPTRCCGTWCGCWWGRCSSAPTPRCSARCSPARPARRPAAPPRPTVLTLLSVGVRYGLARYHLRYGVRVISHQRRRHHLARACSRPSWRWTRSPTVAVIAPDSNRSAIGRGDHDHRSLTITEVELRDGSHRLCHRRYAGRLRPVRRPGPGRRAARPDRLGHQLRRQPGRRRHLLGHGCGRLRGDRARHPGHRHLAAERRSDGRLQAPSSCTTSSRRRRFLRRWSSRSASRACPPAHDPERQRPPPPPRASRWRGWAGASTATGWSSSQTTRAAAATSIYGDDPSYHDEPGTDFQAIARGLIAVTPIHLDLTSQSAIAEIEAWSLESE